jgi:hypothetical protein
MSKLESTYQSTLFLRAPHVLTDLRLFRRQIMAGRIHGRRMSSGIAGQADVYGYWRNGLGVEIELKSLSGSLEPEQRVWRDWCLEWGVPHLVLKPLRDETVAATIERWIEQIAGTRHGHG